MKTLSRVLLLVLAAALLALWPLSHLLVESPYATTGWGLRKAIVLWRTGPFSALLLRGGTFEYMYTGWFLDPLTGARKPVYGCTAAIPIWVGAAYFAAYPAYCLFTSRLHRYLRKKRGLCLACGYSLRVSRMRHTVRYARWRNAPTA